MIGGINMMYESINVGDLTISGKTDNSYIRLSNICKSIIINKIDIDELCKTLKKFKQRKIKNDK